MLKTTDSYKLIIQTFCKHRFAIEDLKRLDELNVEWQCSDCGKVFTASCGLSIPTHGRVFRRSIHD